MKITILWSSLASYSVSFFRELAASQRCSLQLIYQATQSESPYNNFDLSFCESALEDSPEVKKRLYDLVCQFNPDCVLMSSWAFPHFMHLCKRLRQKGVYVVSAMDNQWQGTLKQWAGIFISKWFLKPSIDTFLVAGDRHAVFARKLGYDEVLYGLYAAEVDKFSMNRNGTHWPRSFLFVGRLVKAKGVNHLIQAYRDYRSKSENPWDLKIAGTGPLLPLLDGEPGVDYLGFVQPEELPDVMKGAGCLVIPSLWEPWGVVIHEACAAGLPVIATFPCGAVTDFVRDGINGFIVPPRADRLADAILKMTELDVAALEKMSKSSIRLASFRTPRILAEYFNSSVEKRIS